VRLETHETEASSVEVARRAAHPALRPYLLAEPEGWAQTRGQSTAELREVPFPGIPLILNLGAPWAIASADRSAFEPHDSFLAGLHTRPTFVRGAERWACIELRLTPLGAHRVLGLPMHELENRTVPLDDVLANTGELTGRLRDARSWTQRFDLVESFLLRRLDRTGAPEPAVGWAWAHLRRTGGSIPIRALADDLGWSHRRLIFRFREQIGVAPKTFARLVRFDRAVSALRGGRGLAETAFESGYFDQAHMTRDFRELAGTTPAGFAAATLDSGGVAA
jgi:AraC-like DNA-binding protein